jgi:spore coat protein CotH
MIPPRYVHPVVTAALTLVSLASASHGQGHDAPGPDSLFGLRTVSEIHLHVEVEEWAQLQPPEDTNWDIGSAIGKVGRDAKAGRHFHSEESSRPGLAGYAGIDHEYGKADITIDGETVRDVGLRYKGNGTFLEGRGTGKFSFKVDFNEYEDDQEFRGLTKINLQNNITDPSMLREALSYELFREAGIPCSRVGWAKVTLTVPGQFEERNLGLYSLVETVDKRFLKGRFGSAKGLLLKPSTFGVCRYFGEDWQEYEKGYVPKTNPKAEQKRHLIDFARLVQHADDGTFAAQVEDYLDVDEFLRFLAMNVLLCNLDSFLGGSQNYYVYLEPESNRFQLWPWDMDHSFGAFDPVGDPESRRALSIDHPHWGGNRLIERVLEIPRHRDAYHNHLEQYLGTVFAEEKLHRQITEAADFLRPLILENGKHAPDRFERLVADSRSTDAPNALKRFVTKRRESVTNQLAGHSEGRVLRWGGSELDFGRIGPIVIAVIAIGAVMVVNFGVYIWAAVAGFNGSAAWGILNLLFYPVAPIVYGFTVRTDLGQRAAIAALGSVVLLALVILISVSVLS